MLNNDELNDFEDFVASYSMHSQKHNSAASQLDDILRGKEPKITSKDIAQDRNATDSLIPTDNPESAELSTSEDIIKAIKGLDPAETENQSIFKSKADALDYSKWNSISDNEVPENKKQPLLPTAQLKNTADRYMATKHYDKAIAIYTQIQRSSKVDPAIYLNRALGYLKQRDYKSCIADCNSAIATGGVNIPKSQMRKAVFRRGSALLEILEYQDAKTDFSALLADSEFDAVLKNTMIKQVNEMDFLLIESEMEKYAPSIDSITTNNDHLFRMHIARNIPGAINQLNSSSIKQTHLITNLFESCAVEPYFIDQLMKLPTFSPSLPLIKAILACEYTRTEYFEIMIERWNIDICAFEAIPSMLLEILQKAPMRLDIDFSLLVNSIVDRIHCDAISVWINLLQVISLKKAVFDVKFIRLLWDRKELGLLNCICKHQPHIVFGQNNQDMKRVLLDSIDTPVMIKYAVNLCYKHLTLGGTLDNGIELFRDLMSMHIMTEVSIGNAALCVVELLKCHVVSSLKVLQEIAENLLESAKTAKSAAVRKNIGICLSTILIKDERLKALIRTGNGLELLHSIAQRD